jgi:hypothetical protein
VGRVSGPYGHAVCRTIDEVRSMVTSQNVRNAIPRSNSAAVLVLYHDVEQLNTVSELIPYYIGVRDEKIRVVQQFVMKIGTKCKDTFSSLIEGGRIPPGALAYPQYKVYMVARAMKDIEMHSLDNTVHLSSRYRNASNNYRGGWAHNLQTREIEYYPECGAMTRLVDLKGN